MLCPKCAHTMGTTRIHHIKRYSILIFFSLARTRSVSVGSLCKPSNRTFFFCMYAVVGNTHRTPYCKVQYKLQKFRPAGSLSPRLSLSLTHLRFLIHSLHSFPLLLFKLLLDLAESSLCHLAWNDVHRFCTITTIILLSIANRLQRDLVKRLGRTRCSPKQIHCRQISLNEVVARKGTNQHKFYLSLSNVIV